MKYSPQALEELAAQYVVGTLRHAARARFERLCATNAAARAACERWEDRLLPLALQSKEEMPALSTWLAIQKRVNPSDSRRRWWPLALAASVLLGVLLVGRMTLWKQPEWVPIAVLAQTNAAPVWRLERSTDAHRISMRTVGLVNLPADRSYELWLLPNGAGKPVSLGLMPREGEVSRPVTEAEVALLRNATKVAISLEPVGGSPTGQPTGPVVMVAPLTWSS